MNSRRIAFSIFVLLAFIQVLPVTATTFITDTYIGPTDFSSDGDDIIVTNCTLTVDGAHGFNSLQLQNGGILTHSAFTNGPLQITNIVTDEIQTLSTNIPAALLNTNVDTNTIVVMDSSATITYTPNVDYLITTSNQFTKLTLTTNSSIAQGTNVLVNYTWYQNYQGFTLTISNDMQVLTGGAVNIQGKGYAGGNGPGAGTSQSTNFPSTFTAGGGGAHAGCGGMSSTFAFGGGSYDSTTNSASLGSGGGTGSDIGAPGGGLAQLFIGGTLQVDGQILADGLAATNAHAGGGAGGGLLLSAQTFSGAGTISAQGGAGNLPDGGGGGGGIIAIYSATNTFTGNVSAVGGAGANYGGAGTILTKFFTNGSGQLVISNAGTLGTNTLFFAPAVSNLTISAGAVAQPQNTGFSVSNLFVGSNSWFITPASGSLTVTINGNATVESNAFLNADSKSASGFGSGGSACGAGTGGGYYGNGGAASCGGTGGNAYGFTPGQNTALGSPGGGSPAPLGGGAIILNVAGILSIDGQLSANGAGSSTTNGGGGSGGSVSLTVGTISGGGTIAANGGSANNPYGGGGGGGSVGIVFQTNLFTGPITAYGGSGANDGGAGAIYLKTNGTSIAQIIVDNAGLTAVTPLNTQFFRSDLTVRGGAVVTDSQPSMGSLRNLLIASNSFISGSGSGNLTATNVVIQPGGGFDMDSQPVSDGSGGTSVNSTGGGGGNGGCGGMSISNAAGGGSSSLTSITTVTLGSPGGSGQSGLGGKGGAVVNLTVPGTLQMDGSISANGGTSASLNSGGGSGGGIKLVVAMLTGGGTISANGGAANNLGGGGGGGRIVILYQTNAFSGTMTAYGGAGANYGGAGTIYQAQTATFGGTPLSQQIIADNGGVVGTNTVLLNGGTPIIFDLVIQGGASVSDGISGALTNGNLFVGSNSVFRMGAASQQLLDILTNAVIQPGGAIRDDGVIPLPSNSSGGQSLNNSGGGGGYGGVGGSSSLGARGGTVVVDSFTSPSSTGAPGGNGGPSGGNGGGGSLRIVVSNLLQLDGTISAQGTSESYTNSGGGSGGSVWLSAHTLSGAGTISVNGAAGNGAGGGGGGGRIALYYNTNLFTGNLTAYGGGGANYGGAGTIYTSSSFSGLGQFTSLTVDNGGASGQETVLNGNTVYGTSFPPTISSLRFTGGGIVDVTNAFTDHTMWFGNLFIGSNSTFVYEYSSTGISNNATIQNGGSFTIAANGSISGRTMDGHGSGSGGGGGGHGGYGGQGSGQLPYPLGLGGSVTDSITAPISSGGAGGLGLTSSSGNGGGSIPLIVNGIFQVDGQFSADGATSLVGTNSGGGAGGAIWIRAGVLAGQGNIHANGAAGNNLGGGGGGGRIAIWANTNIFAGSITARGGAGAEFGGPGTIYFNSSTNGNGISSPLIIDGGGITGAPSGITTPVNGWDIVLTNGSSLAVAAGGNVDWNSLTIASNCALVLATNFTVLNLTIDSNLVISPTAAINFNGQGWGPNFGPGSGSWDRSGGGGGHGGVGGPAANPNAIGGRSYDSITAPVLPGSAGGNFGASGSFGGGALNLTVNGLLQVDGAISANGQAGVPGPNYGAGGGAGGSIYLTIGTLAGSGSISANGGTAVTTNGGGAGGRIALYFNSNNFTGNISASGGTGMAIAGGAGTIYLQSNSAPFGQLIVDNGGIPGINTPLDSLTQSLPVSISNGATASSGVPLTLQSLSIGSNALFTANSQKPLTLTVLGDAFVDTNAAIIANGTGYNPGTGPGSGGVDASGDGSGGGYGGNGGASLGGSPGGTTYGSSNEPVDFGSAGGVTNLPASQSQGGGAIRMIVDGNLTLNGTVSANGNNARTNGAGGGSGGSIWLAAETLSGNGLFTANGGTGDLTAGGGGGGGRIAIYASSTNSFAGNASAIGGNGFSTGQPGTIVIATNLLVSGSVTDTNGTGISGITLQPNGLASVSTDNTGAYSVATPLFWTGSITPTSPAGFYLPSQRNYSSLSGNMPNQNFIQALPSDFNFTGTQFDGTNNATFNWYGINGVSYQPLVSSNLLNWAPYGPPITGTNGPATFLVPVTNAPQQFFRLNVNY